MAGLGAASRICGRDRQPGPPLRRRSPPSAAHHLPERAPHRRPAALEHVGVDLRGALAGMPELLLDRADVGAALEPVGCEAGAQRVADDRLADLGVAHRALHRARVEVVAAESAIARVRAGARGRGHELPGRELAAPGYFRATHGIAPR